MIICKTIQFATPEQDQKREELWIQAKVCLDRMGVAIDNINSVIAPNNGADQESKRLYEQYTKEMIDSRTDYLAIDNQLEALDHEIIEAYLAHFKGSQDAIMENVREIIDAIDQADFLKWARIRHQSWENVKAYSEEHPEDDRPGTKPGYDYGIPNYENCFTFMLNSVIYEEEAFFRNKLPKTPLLDYIDAKVQSWYEKPEPLPAKIAKYYEDSTRPAPVKDKSLEAISSPYFTSVHGKATDALALMTNRDAQVDSITGQSTITRNGVTLSTQALAGVFGVGCHKIFNYALGLFTQQNTISDIKRDLRNVRLFIPFDDYALLRNYDVVKHETTTPEEKKAETRRAKKARDKAREAFKQDLDALLSACVTWEESVQGEWKSYKGINYLSSYEINRDCIMVEFPLSMAEYLVQLPMTQTPYALQSIDGRQPNAYRLGLKISQHYSMNNNVKSGTNNKLSVTSLLEATTLPSYQETKAKDNRGWKRLILEPFETALDTLVEVGYLESWKYTQQGSDKAIPREKVHTVASFMAFTKLNVQYRVKYEPEYNQRLLEKSKELKAKYNSGDKPKASKRLSGKTKN